LSKIQRGITDGECLELLLTRSKESLPTVGGDDDESPREEPWTLTVTADISQLLTPDVRSCSAICITTQPTWESSMSVSKDKHAARSVEFLKALTMEDPTSRFQCTLPLSLTKPLQKTTIAVECELLTADDVVPPRRTHPKKPPRKFEDELRGELTEMVRAVCAEYEVLFKSTKMRPMLGVKDRGAQLLEVLSTAGVRHDFLERLKPVVQRAVASRFGRAPCSEEEKDKYLTELYSWLMNCVSQILSTYYAPVVAKEQEEIAKQRRDSSAHNPSGEAGAEKEHSQEVSEILEVLEELRVVAIDQEAMGEWTSTMTKNEDRVTEAVNWLVTSPE